MKPTLRLTLLSCAVMLLLAPAAVHAASETIYPDTLAPASRASDAPNWELGTIFRPKVAGKITQVRVFSLADESGDHQVRLWRNADNTVVAGPITWTFGGEEAWITMDIPDVSVQAGQDYTISISTTPEGWYPVNGGYFASAGSNGQFLNYPQSAGVFSDTAGLRPTNSFNNAAYLRDIVFEPDLSGAFMQVKWNGVEIPDGSTNRSGANGTDLGGRGLNAGSRDLTYTINNLGQTALQLTGTPRVAISGAQASDFAVTTQPAATVAAGGSTTFTIRFDPSAIGVRQAAVSIPHGDSPGNAYDFAIQGEGLGGGAGVLGNDSDGAFARNIDATQIHGNRFQAPVAMRLTELHAKVLELVGVFKCAIYSDTNGVADSFLRGSVDVVNATNGWNTFPLTSPLDLTAGDWYWLVIWSDTQGARVQADPVGQGYFGVYSFNDLGGQWPDPISLAPLVGDAASRTYCIYGEGAPIGIAPGPELDLRGNGKLIVSGDSTPSALDGTDFGSRNLGGDAQDRTFTIENRGDAALALIGNPSITITGPNAADWTVTSPPASPVAPGGSTQFTVRFSPTAPGFRSATISIGNGDADENPYRFAVQGAGLTTGRESIFPDTKIGRDIDFDGTYYELGTIFRASVPGAITHLRVYALASESGDHTARIWRNSDETVVGGPYTWNYGGAAGWITLDIPNLDIDAGVDYTVSISTGTSPKRNYPNIAADLSTAGGNGQHLSYPVNAGVFTTTTDARPTGFFNGGNYLRDVVFVPAGRESIFPDTKIGRDIDFDGTYYELGTVFQSSVVGKITHLRVYALASESGDHTARLWRNDNESVIGGPYTWNYGGATGWITLDIPDVDIEAGVDYTVSISTGTSPKRNYPNIAADLSTAGGNGQHLSYPVNAGVFTTTTDARPTGFFNGGNYLRDVIFLRAGAVVAEVPDVDVKGNNTSIADGDVSPGSGDGTDFGQAAVGGSVQRIFIIANVGTAPLNLSGTPRVAISGPQAGDFTVTAQPGTPITPAGNSSFTIRFAPSATGVRNATVSIANDSGENPFDFAISGAGTGATTEFRLIEVKPDLATGNITLRWVGDGPQFQVEKAPAVTGPFQPIGLAQSTRVFTDAGALQAGGKAFYRVRTSGGGGTNVVTNVCSTATAGAGWVNTAMANQTGTFSVQFDATPSVAPLDSVMALSAGTQTAYSGFACLARFSTAGVIDARNGAGYAADNQIPYSANLKYHFRMAINVPAHTYSIYVTPTGGAEQTVGADFAFRADQSTVTHLDHWGVTVDAASAGTNTVCNFQMP